MRIIVETPIVRTPRVLQVEGAFDLKPAEVARLEWDVALPLDQRPWHIGLIVGPSGCGKSTIARQLFGGVKRLESLADWPADRSLLDAFPASVPIKELVALLSSVGLSSPPVWLRPFHVLSSGQQFRAALARLLAESGQHCMVVDEFTSLVDRTAAQLGSAALARAVRQRGQRFVAVTCHDDVEPWLQPDWTYQPATGSFAWRRLPGRPAIVLEIVRCRRAAWQAFRPHHYLSHELAPAAVCFLACWQDRPVAFSAWIHHLARGKIKREHRTVTLPDYQGVGIGMALSDFCASLWRGLGFRATSTTTHPAFVAARLRSAKWRLRRRPSLARQAHESRRRRLGHAATRLTAGFEYVGPPLDPALARRLLE